MNTIVLICIITATFAFCMGIVYFILTLVQITKLIKEMQYSFDEVNKRIEKLNETIDNTTRIVDDTLAFFSMFSSGAGKTISIISSIYKFFNKKKSNKTNQEA